MTHTTSRRWKHAADMTAGAPSLFDLPPVPPRGAYEPYGGQVGIKNPNNRATVEAAAKIARSVTGLRATVLKYIVAQGDFGATNEELGAHLADRKGLTDRWCYPCRSTASARCTELRHMGLIRDSEKQRPARNGSKITVWTATPEGEKEANQ